MHESCVSTHSNAHDCTSINVLACLLSHTVTLTDNTKHTHSNQSSSHPSHIANPLPHQFPLFPSYLSHPEVDPATKHISLCASLGHPLHASFNPSHQLVLSLSTHTQILVFQLVPNVCINSYSYSPTATINPLATHLHSILLVTQQFHTNLPSSSETKLVHIQTHFVHMLPCLCSRLLTLTVSCMTHPLARLLQACMIAHPNSTNPTTDHPKSLNAYMFPYQHWLSIVNPLPSHHDKSSATLLDSLSCAFPIAVAARNLTFVWFRLACSLMKVQNLVSP
jgi:hypothetical protein